MKSKWGVGRRELHWETKQQARKPSNSSYYNVFNSESLYKCYCPNTGQTFIILTNHLKFLVIHFKAEFKSPLDKI